MEKKNYFIKKKNARKLSKRTGIVSKGLKGQIKDSPLVKDRTIWISVWINECNGLKPTNMFKSIRS